MFSGVSLLLQRRGTLLNSYKKACNLSLVFEIGTLELRSAFITPFIMVERDAIGLVNYLMRIIIVLSPFYHCIAPPLNVVHLTSKIQNRFHVPYCSDDGRGRIIKQKDLGGNDIIKRIMTPSK